MLQTSLVPKQISTEIYGPTAMTFDNPTEQLPNLFVDAGDGRDGKDIVDSLPRRPIGALAVEYQQQVRDPATDWHAFYQANFEPPEAPGENLRARPGQTMEDHIENMWPVLTRQASQDTYSLIGLPNPTVVPGERFRESYYWDTYFTMRGLAAAGKWELVEGMLDNCAYQIERFGYVLNGSRQYYLGRSQPPVFSLMVRLVAEHRAMDNPGDDNGEGYGATLTKYLPHMVREHDFWMDGRDELARGIGGQALKRVVRMPDDTLLNRYYDANSTPRPESYRKDVLLGRAAGIEQPSAPHEFYRNIRAAAESGWDFSGRWCDDGNNLSTINTTNIVPVDLNSLLYDLEQTISEAYGFVGDTSRADLYRIQAKNRAAAINRYSWDASKGFYYDFHLGRGEHTDYPTIAAAYPLRSGIAAPEQADAVLTTIQNKFLLPGGVATTLHDTHEQWDGLKGWAPNQTIARQAALNYGHTAIAAAIRTSWLERNRQLFDQTGQLHEKIQVGDEVAAGNGGEYAGQTGFGWTNGSLVEFVHAA